MTKPLKNVILEGSMLLLLLLLLPKPASAQLWNIFHTARVQEPGDRRIGVAFDVDDEFDFFDLTGRFELGVMPNVEVDASGGLVFGDSGGDSLIGFQGGGAVIYQLIEDTKAVPLDVAAYGGLHLSLLFGDTDVTFLPIDLLLLLSKRLELPNLNVEPYLGFGVDILYSKASAGGFSESDTEGKFTLPFGLRGKITEKLDGMVELRFIGGDLTMGLFAAYTF
ncbi:MAG: hypothetical protein D6812_00735 [Deltaproteobacteria bacterium]|nr:MAG: hypothetical protein D6812_00735 [Deltaproteobacteria bacterium]